MGVLFWRNADSDRISPRGNRIQGKNKVCKVFNLPELIALFKECADIQTPDMLKLPVPEAEYENVVLKPSEHQQDMVASLAERAEEVRNRKVDITVDNMRERYVTATNHEENVTKAVAGVQ